jgi:diguanylate cyclase (GGDEF)-like protein
MTLLARTNGFALRHLFEGPRRVWLFVTAVATANVLIWVVDVGSFEHAGFLSGVTLTWWELAPAFYLAEVFAVHLHFRKQAHTLSLSEVGLAFGLFFASPANLLVANVVGATAALVINRRQRAIKLAFNLAELPLCTGVAVYVFRSLATPESGPRVWAVAMLAAAAAHLLGIVLVSTVIAVAEKRLSAPQLPETLAVSLVGATATTSLGLAGVVLIARDPVSGILLVAPVLACGFAFRGYMAQREQREHVEFLYESMRATQSAPDFSQAIGRLLGSARRLLRAEYAEILLLSLDTDEPPVRSVSVEDDRLLMEIEERRTPSDELALRVAGAGRPTLLGRRREPHLLDPVLASRNLGDAIVGALRGDDGPFGLLIVGDRAGDVTTFGDGDLELFETFAGHASILLENGRLEHSLANITELTEELKHQAYHDTLTGLPNRFHFVESLADRLKERTPESRIAVLYVDLDGFKSVNDTWGHHIGDELLAQVGARIRGAVRAGDLPARLGGDEFAVLVEQADEEAAEHAARRLTNALVTPFALSAGETTIHASIGISLSRPGVSTAEDLIRNADLAMYRAKEGVHRPAATRANRGTALDLELAVKRGEIEVRYQPIVSLRDGGIHAFEALVRWRHPDRGLLLPSDFMTTAEASGLIVEIGMDVAERALAFAGTWPDGLGLWMNFGAVELADERLAPHLADALAKAGVPADRMTIEISESSLIGHEQMTLAAMHRLRALGLHLSIDDFGAGYSSLSRLGELPIELLKIPKPFVTRLVGEEGNELFVDAILRLAESLDLVTVSEGVEQVPQLQRLLQLGCALGQGFLFSKPLAEAEVVELLADPDRYRGLVARAHAALLENRSVARAI